MKGGGGMDSAGQKPGLRVLGINDNVDGICESVSWWAVNTYPTELVGALHTAHLDVSVLSSWDDLYTVKITGQDYNITARTVGLRDRWEEKPNQTELWTYTQRPNGLLQPHQCETAYICNLMSQI